MKLPDPIIIDTPKGLRDLVADLRDAPMIAVDTESNSLFAYYEQVCLIQLSVAPIPNEIQDFIIDPLMIENMSPLGELFADPKIEIVFHAAEYDILSLKRDFGYEFTNLFDTFIAARTLGDGQLGLQALIEEYFGLAVDKQYQQADWSVRPLPLQQLRYAQKDTHYLPALRHIYFERLLEGGFLAEARDYFERMAQTPAAEKIFDPEGFWKIKTPRQLSGRELAVLRALYFWREEIAQRKNLPPFKIMQNYVLVTLATRQPRNMKQLANIRQVSKSHLNRYGREILRTIKQAKKQPIPEQKRQKRPRRDVMSRFKALSKWRKARAERRGVDSDIILSKDAMWALAHQVPSSIEELADIDEIGTFRCNQYGHELLSILATTD